MFTPEEQQIIDWSKKNGKTVQEMKDAIFRYRTTGSPADPNKPKPQETNPAADFGVGVVKGAGESLRFASDFVAGAVPGAIAGPLSAIPGVRDAISGPIQTLKTAQQSALGLTDENLTATTPAQQAGKYTEIGLEFLTPFAASRFAGLLGRGANLATKAPVAAQGVKDASFLEKGVEKVGEFVKNPRLAFAKENVSPQLEASANRLFLEGTERLKDPIVTYDKYVNQARTALKDIKVDPPVAVVGESIGDAFKSVVAQRRVVGKTMENELKKVAGVKTDVLPAVDTFVADLSKEGLIFDRVSKKVIKQAKQTKMTSDDVKLIEDFATEMQKLGSKPTIGELDAFMSRVQKEMEIYKSSKNIVGGTNAERIIKKTLADFRDQFNPKANPALEGYYNARKQYSDLSNFIDDGIPFLGKITQSGDFAKDASLSKSAVQSVLNNGKKDFLVKLEELTGYPALDDSVLALQAMKDAGDFRGLSLLDSLSQGQVPLSQQGITQKVIDFALDKAGKIVGGTPEQQTRAFLQALKEEASKQAPQAAFGAAGGINPQTGDIDPLTAALGVGGAALGLKITKDMEPITLVKKMTAGQYKALKEFTNLRTSANAEIPFGAFSKVDDVLEPLKIDISKMSLKELDDYIKAIVDAYESSI